MRELVILYDELTVRSNRFSAGPSALTKPHLRRSSQGEASTVWVRPTARRQRLSSQTDSAAKPRYTHVVYTVAQ